MVVVIIKWKEKHASMQRCEDSQNTLQMKYVTIIRALNFTVIVVIIKWTFKLFVQANVDEMNFREIFILLKCSFWFSCRQCRTRKSETIFDTVRYKNPELSVEQVAARCQRGCLWCLGNHHLLSTYISWSMEQERLAFDSSDLPC